MAFKVPPANTLRFFEAAARLKGFKQAAEEIHVTPSAVSHGINTLERWLEVQLFARNSHGLALTEAGEIYLPEVRKALSILASAAERLPGRQAMATLSINTPVAFATRWLLPRLRSFTQRYPIRVIIETDPERRTGSSGVDLAVKRASASEAESDWVKLTSEKLSPVCSPTLRVGLGADEDAAKLRKANLIYITTETEDWETWFAVKGIRAPSGNKSIYVDSVQLALEAAKQGLGIALGRRPLIDSEVSDGSLVEIGGPAVENKISYWLVTTESRSRSETGLFSAWMAAEFDSVARPAATALFRAM